MPHLEITEVVLVHCNFVDSGSRVLYTFVTNSQLRVITIRYFNRKFHFSKTFNSEFSFNEVWFADQNSKPLKIEDNINITLLVSQCTI